MNKDMKFGIVFTTIGRYGNFIITLIVNAILSRLLTPADYGVVAIIMVFVTFFQLLSNMGIGPAIVQNKTLNDEDISSLYGISGVLSIALPIMFIIVGFLISLFYENSIFIPLSIVLSISLIFYSLIIVPDAILTKEKKFKEINVIFLMSSLIGGCVGITLAIIGFGVYSLVWNTVVASIINFFLKWKITNVKIGKITQSSFDKIKIFVKNQLLASLINYFGKNLDNLLIGKQLGASDLGNYSKAYQLIMYPNFLFGGIINSILLPFLSDVQEDTERVIKMYLNVLKVLLLLGIPLSFFMYIYGKQIIFFVFGDQWSAAVFPFQVLSLTVWIQMVQASAEPIFQARNRTDYLLTTSIFNIICLVIAIILGITLKSINYISIFLSISFFISVLYRLYILFCKVLFASFLESIRVFFKPLLIGVIYFVIGLFTKKYIELVYGNFVQLLLSGFVWLFTVVALVILFKEHTLIKKIIK